MDPTRSPGRSLALGAASDIRPLAVLAGGADVRFPTLGPPASEGLDVRAAAGGGGGPIEVLLPPTLSLGFDNVTEGFLAFEGVPVRGVEAFDVAAESCFVGDLVGDCNVISFELLLHLVITYSKHTRGSRSSGSRTRAGSIHAHPFPSYWIWCAAQSLSQPRPRNTAWPCWPLDG